MDKNYYLEYYQLEREHWWFKARLELLKDQVAAIAKNNNNLSILNIGVATGATSIMLQQFGKVKSIEYDKLCFEFVKETLQIDIEQGTILDLQFGDNSYDLVCAFDVIEHVQDDVKAVSEMQRVCKPNGSILLAVPALMVLWSKHDEVNHHFKRYTVAELKKLLSTNGNIVYVSYFNSILFPFILAFRIIGNWFPALFKREGSGSDFSLMKNRFLNMFFYHIMRSESFFLNRNIKLPFGVSAIISWKKS